ncbi:aspartic proteinase Asp1-like [Tripterygium wilfordii]|uniref:aspartic proteinase Asp1-like n=1 Tax=Tripterygium wilfordii TaxID=458696 RepID=UPI0018F8432D|nr:aspartic proteinase Asp1-like [Tripterygium wilfordii]
MSQERSYKPPKDSIIHCEDPLCVAFLGNEQDCPTTRSRCEYVYRYADDSFAHGYLVRDVWSIQLRGDSVIYPHLVFGCGYKQGGVFKGDGILGLNKGPISFLSQMHSHGVIQQVIGHCLSSEEGGFLFLGDGLVPPTGLSWTPMIKSSEKDYLLGPANLLFGGSWTQMRGLEFSFDSGCALSSLNQRDYHQTIDVVKIKNNLSFNFDLETHLRFTYIHLLDSPSSERNSIDANTTRGRPSNMLETQRKTY